MYNFKIKFKFWNLELRKDFSLLFFVKMRLFGLCVVKGFNFTVFPPYMGKKVLRSRCCVCVCVCVCVLLLFVFWFLFVCCFCFVFSRKRGFLGGRYGAWIPIPHVVASWLVTNRRRSSGKEMWMLWRLNFRAVCKDDGCGVAWIALLSVLVWMNKGAVAQLFGTALPPARTHVGGVLNAQLMRLWHSTGRFMVGHWKPDLLSDIHKDKRSLYFHVQYVRVTMLRVGVCRTGRRDTSSGW